MRVVEVFILLIDLCLCIHDLQQVSGLKIQHSHHSLQLMITSHPDWYLLRQSSMLPGHPDGQDSIIVLEDSSAAFQEAEQGDMGSRDRQEDCLELANRSQYLQIKPLG